MSLFRVRGCGWLLLLWCLVDSSQVASAQVTKPSFEVATVKPAPGADPNTGSWSLPGTGRFSAAHVSLELLIQLAYGVDKTQIFNKPEWLVTSLYDIAAKPEDGIKLTREELQPRLQELLRQRFHLVVHAETRPVHGFALVVSKSGAHMASTKGDHFPGFRINVSSGEMRGANWTMATFARYLTPAAGFPVVDQTGLAGSYDIGFSYQAGGDVEGKGGDLESNNGDAESNLPPLATALKDATGLMLKPQMVPVEAIVIDSADKVPTEN